MTILRSSHSRVQAKLARLGVILFKLLYFADFETPDPKFLRHRSIFVINIFEDPTFILH
jgi:hypothetical protein